MPDRVDVIGLNETRQHMENVARSLHGDAMVNTVYKAANLVLRDAKKFAPVDTGRLRSSIVSQVRSVNFPRRVEGVVSSNVEYAPHMEYGTEHNKMPPIAALQGWARRHGLNAFLVARAILRRGGLKGRFYFKQAVDKNRAAINTIFQKHVSDAINRNP